MTNENDAFVTKRIADVERQLTGLSARQVELSRELRAMRHELSLFYQTKNESALRAHERIDRLANSLTQCVGALRKIYP